MKITEYPSITDFYSANDVLVTDGDNGTKQIKVVDALLSAMHLTSAQLHRSIFRGKYLGSSVTTEQLAAIQAGTFDDLWLGDYWTISGVNYRIWDMDYWYKAGDTSFTNHHLVIMPDTALYTAQMNSTNITTGGYVGSEMYTANLSSAKTTISAAFGSALLTHREYLTNAVTNGYPSAGAWLDSNVELPNEIMMYGGYVYTPGASSSGTVPNRYTISKKQLALAALCPEYVNIRATYWLRDVVSSAYFAYVNNNGGTSFSLASNSYGVRPVFPIG